VQCSSCPKSFRGYDVLETHLRNFHNPIKCTLCKKTMAGKIPLRDHVRQVHKESRSALLCLACGEAFGNAYLLSRHITTFHGNNPFKCSLCSASFKRKYYLDDHFIATHTNQRFPCPHCGKEFKAKRLLERHIRTMHAAKQTSLKKPDVQGQMNIGCKYGCVECNLFFTKRATLDEHYELVHNPTILP